MDLALELQKIYDSEINLRISWLWDGGIEVRLGDEINGFLAEETLAHAAGIAPWLQQAIAHFYPDSPYARALPDEVRQPGRAAPLPAAQRRHACPLSALRNAQRRDSRH